MRFMIRTKDWPLLVDAAMVLAEPQAAIHVVSPVVRRLGTICVIKVVWMDEYFAWRCRRTDG